MSAEDRRVEFVTLFEDYQQKHKVWGDAVTAVDLARRELDEAQRLQEAAKTIFISVVLTEAEYASQGEPLPGAAPPSSPCDTPTGSKSE